MTRSFDDFHGMVAEIVRDVSKSPRTMSGRVQQLINKPMIANEALNYGYQIHSIQIPDSPRAILEIAKEFLPHYQNPKHFEDTAQWMEAQNQERATATEIDTYDPEFMPSDFLHPALKLLAEQEQPYYDYLYAERLKYMDDTILEALQKDDTSRRAYWPIYWEQDISNIAEAVRIPCSLGFHFVIREIPIIGKQLHFTYLQRSADLEIFFLTDLWLAAQVQQRMSAMLDIPAGIFNHYILSLHRFQREGEEIY